jgi:ribonuclease III
MAVARLEHLYKLLGHRFRDQVLIKEALTHPSLERRRRAAGDYERLEFLGDRVLGLTIAGALFEADRRASAGELAVRFNALVRKETVAEVAREIGLGPHLILSQSEEQVGGRDKEAILANACEALLGALYLDAGLTVAQGFIMERWGERIGAAGGTEKDPKTRLQELVQQGTSGPPSYRIVDEAGPPHDRRFTVEVETEDGARAAGEGRSRRAAEQDAASRLLERLQGHG